MVVSTVRFLAEIIPWVSEVAYSDPNGDPIAKAVSPTLMLSELPKLATVVTADELIFNTAKSVTLSVPTILAGSFLPLLIIISSELEPLTTWLFVTI